MSSNTSYGSVGATRVLKVNLGNLGRFKDKQSLETWELPTITADLEPLQEAAKALRETNTPVGFPTETVYGLGADATRSDAVKGIYQAKGRPSDNPLIIHVCDLTMLRSLITSPGHTDGDPATADSIPAIYKPLIEKFWPGPLTILLPNPKPSKLAPEVTAGLPTFGARMPDSALALSLIHLASVPLAAPSANASTKPSPTTAEHVRYDLDGKIDIILDGGPCQVGVESTVVDGLCDPPVVLRPGGVSIDRIRECKGWSGVVKGYKDQSEIGASAPRAPGMKYKHYSPKAKVVLYEATKGGNASTGIPSETRKIIDAMNKNLPHLGYESLGRQAKIGIVRTKTWTDWAAFNVSESQVLQTGHALNMQQAELHMDQDGASDTSGQGRCIATATQISLGNDTKDIAHGLFSALRELDQREVDVIYVEGIEDEGDIAAAIMNRLRKAATKIESS